MTFYLPDQKLLVSPTLYRLSFRFFNTLYIDFFINYRPPEFGYEP